MTLFKAITAEILIKAIIRIHINPASTAAYDASLNSSIRFI
jgi:hypothetical protein